MSSVQVYGQPGSGRTSLANALREFGIDAHECEFPALAFREADPGIADLGAVDEGDSGEGAFGDGAAPAVSPAEVDSLVVLAASARDGIDAPLADWWEELAESFTPRLLVWTFTDVGRADDDDMRAITERILGEPNYAVALPLADDDDEFAGVLDLRDASIHEAGSAGSTVRPADAEHESIAAPLLDELIDAVLANSDDESALASRMAGMSLSPQRLRQLLAAAMAGGTVVVSMPVRAVAPLIGVDVLADVIAAVLQAKA